MDGFVDLSDTLSGLVNFHDSSAELNYSSSIYSPTLPFKTFQSTLETHLLA